METEKVNILNFSIFYNQFEPKSDKGTSHDYIDGWYSNEFTPIRYEKLNIVEIGVNQGYSLKLLNGWFVNSNIVGIDNFSDRGLENIANSLINDFKLKIIQKDAYMKETLDMFEDESIDYLIDDGPHTIESQLYTIKNWFSKVKIGGTLIIEDISNIDTDKIKIDNICNQLNLKYELIDLRKNKNRKDDVLLIFRK